jgi:hypothetical protein
LIVSSSRLSSSVPLLLFSFRLAGWLAGWLVLGSVRLEKNGDSENHRVKGDFGAGISVVCFNRHGVLVVLVSYRFVSAGLRKVAP